METRKSLNAKIYVKSWCSKRVFLVTVANADIGSLKFYLWFHNECLCHKLAIFEHIRIIRTRWNVQFLVKKHNRIIRTRWNVPFLVKKASSIFHRVHAILEDVSVAKTIVWGNNISQKTCIFQCSKIYGNPTNVT